MTTYKLKYTSHPRAIVLATIYVAEFIVVMNVTIVNVSLPLIQRDLHFDFSTLTWVVNAYALMLGGFVMLGGRSSDVVGRKITLVAGATLFSVASILCGLAASQWTFLTGRALQGLAAAMIAPATLSILMTSYPDGPERRRAIAIWGGISSVAIGLGSISGGIIVDWLPWYTSFYVSAMLAAAIAISATRYIANEPATSRAFDVAGAVTSTAAAIAIVYTIISTQNDSWPSLVTLIICAIGVVSLTLFFLVERMNEAPLVPPDIVRFRPLVVALAAIFVLAGMVTTVAYVLSLHFRLVMEYTALETSLAFLPPTLVAAASCLGTPWLVMRTNIRVVTLGGLCITAIGEGLLSQAGTSDGYQLSILPAMVVTYLGAASASVALTMIATANLRREHVGLASGLINMAQQIGSAFWLALFVSAVTPSLPMGREGTLKWVDLSDYQPIFLSMLGLSIILTIVIGTALRDSLKATSG